MTYPNAPTALVKSFGDQHDFMLDIKKSRQNGGIETRTTAYSINIEEDSWSLNLALQSQTDKTTIENFILERSNRPFWFENSLYRVVDYSFTWTALDFWELSLRLEHSQRAV